MMKKLLPLLLVFILFSCQKSVVYTETSDDFEDNRWMAKDVKTFSFKLKEDIDAGDIKLKFSHVYDPQYLTVPVAVTIEGPSGEKENILLNLQLKDADGNDLSECSGDICDLHTFIKENVPLKKGDYKITLQNKFAYEYLANALAVGISVERED
ncbi:hypothetical protein [Flavobacterium album]|nr:hypothetical protein [Flavobacterium album]